MWAEFQGRPREGKQAVVFTLRNSGQLAAMNMKKAALGCRVSISRTPMQARRMKALRATRCYQQREAQEVAKKQAGQPSCIIHMVDGSVIGGDYINLEFAQEWDAFEAARNPPQPEGQREGQQQQ